MIVTLSFDIEEFDFPIECGKDIDFDTQISVSRQGVESLLQLINRLGIKATFYVTAHFASTCPTIIEEMVAHGHEIASHDFYHSKSTEPDVVGSKSILESISGQKVTGYRAPRLGTVSSQTLYQAGYKYNSSINPTWIPGRYNNLLVKRCVTKDRDGMLIYPTSVAYPIRIPLFWLALHIMPLPLYKWLSSSALHKDKHLNLYFHPWEFSNRLSNPEFGIPKYLTLCYGDKLLRKLEKYLIWLKECRGCTFYTTIQYLSKYE